MLADKVCAALDTLKDVGYPVTEMVICGGQAKSARWNRYKEKRTGCRFVEPPIPDAELAGDALAALRMFQN
jgi:sugar (pentulose or hexulose) kinase